MTLKHKTVTVMGLGRHGGGVGAARYLAVRGARVTVTDLADEYSLRESLSQLAGAGVQRFRLGEHDEADFRDADLIVVNPAVRPDHRLLQIAMQNGATLTSEIELFMRACPASMIGVTGSNGKSTTTAMIGQILRAAGVRAWVGGNLGGSLLDRLDQITPDDWVVLELSSFQLTHLSANAPGVQIAVVTNCTPNHLDWHTGIADYRTAKRRLLSLQRNARYARRNTRCAGIESRDSPFNAENAHSSETKNPVAVLNTDDSEVDRWSGEVVGRLAPLVDEGIIPPLEIPGRHNGQNARLAATAALAAGCDEDEIRVGLANFRALPHRLNRIGTYGGRMFIDDSQSTTPESAIAALRALDGRVWLLAGGVSKAADSGFRRLASEIVERRAGACFFGTIGGDLFRTTSELRLQKGHAVDGADAFSERPAADQPGFATVNYLPEIGRVDTLAEAMVWCFRRSAPGDALLLSPGCASFDQFRDCQHRAEVFAQLAETLDSAGSAAAEADFTPKSPTNLLANSGARR